MLSNQSVRWYAVSDAALAWREWDGEVVVFNQETGSTHLLNALGAEVLRRLVAAERGATIGALAGELADSPSDADEPEWTRAIGEALSEFARLGLARPEMP
jgi:PqqD family protein of HPr-rel-A system